ncbi:MAG: glycosyltransferase family 2 protein [Proteobacteria bacterium]|nr:glycosyltransferase family 2 protein [Pseudomonadota bacterium]
MISVIIPSYNSAGTIADCIRSVLETGYAPLEILVVDDCSTDESPGIVEGIAAEHADRVRLVRQPRNAGPACARNAGARAAKGEFYFFLDSDTRMLPGALASFRNRIEDADAVVGIYDLQPLNPGAAPLYKALLNYYFFARKGVIGYEVFDSSRAGIRAKAFEAVGGFDESLGWGMDYENEDLGYRLIEQHSMLLDPEISVRHHFPGFCKLARTYFLRVALWMEIFASRRKFESGGVTSAGTGLSSAALLAALPLAMASLLPLPAPAPAGLAATGAVLFVVYLAGYAGFFAFVARHRPVFLVPAVLLNIAFTVIIGAGAAYGLLKVLSGTSRVAAPPARNPSG